MDLYLDCEWADVLGVELVSLALVSADGGVAFYAERDPLPVDPMPWVRTVVYPRLERGGAAMPDALFSESLREFLAAIEQPRICYDYRNDRVLCERALSGFGLDAGDSPEPYAVRWQLLQDVKPSLERWWNEHPDKKPCRHNALADAQALRAAWLGMWGI